VVTIVDVAKRAGVGIGTVSRVLNESPSVASATRARVQAAIQELNYHPSPLAQGLKRGRTHTIVALVPFLTHPSSVERLQGVLPVLNDAGYTLVLRAVETPQQRDEHMTAMTRPHRADGDLIVSLTPSAEEVEGFRNAGTRVVLIDAWHEQLSCVVTDDIDGGRMAARYLLELGHARIAFVGDEPDNSFGFVSSNRRFAGFTEALNDAGVAIPPECVRTAPHGRENARVLAAELLSLDRPPTAIFAASDTQALGILEAAGAQAIAVPDELSVVGFDDIEIAAYAGLTTIRQPLNASGRLAAELLLTALSEPEASVRHETLPLELVERNTTGRHDP
jgi:DNA-binding LacI/PurR family transcriptional regulator